MTDFNPGDGFFEAVAERISKRAEWDGDCLVMRGFQSHNGHVRISVLGKTLSASRAAWMLYNRQAVPEGMVVRHRCDNPPCVARGHLLLGTQGDNMRDMVERQRYRVTVHDATCINGHGRTPENTIVRKDGRRECRDCQRSRDRLRPSRYRTGSAARDRAARHLWPGHEYVGGSDV